MAAADTVCPKCGGTRQVWHIGMTWTGPDAGHLGPCSHRILDLTNPISGHRVVLCDGHGPPQVHWDENTRTAAKAAWWMWVGYKRNMPHPSTLEQERR